MSESTSYKILAPGSRMLSRALESEGVQIGRLALSQMMRLVGSVMSPVFQLIAAAPRDDSVELAKAAYASLFAVAQTWRNVMLSFDAPEIELDGIERAAVVAGQAAAFGEVQQDRTEN